MCDASVSVQPRTMHKERGDLTAAPEELLLAGCANGIESIQGLEHQGESGRECIVVDLGLIQGMAEGHFKAVCRIRKNSMHIHRNHPLSGSEYTKIRRKNPCTQQGRYIPVI